MSFLFYFLRVFILFNNLHRYYYLQKGYSKSLRGVVCMEGNDERITGLNDEVSFFILFPSFKST